MTGWYPGCCCGAELLIICHGKLQTTHSTGMVSRLDPSDGSILWTASLGTGTSSKDKRAITAAIGDDGTIYVVSDLGPYNRSDAQGSGFSPGIGGSTTCPVASLTALDENGSILWQADLPNRRMNAGSAIESLFQTNNRYLPSITIDDSGYLWIAGTMDANGDYIWQCDPSDGSVAAAFGHVGSFSYPYSWPASTGSSRIEVAVSGNNRSFARLRRDPNDKLVAIYTGNGTGDLKIFRFDTSGNVEFATLWDTDNSIAGKAGSSPLPQYIDNNLFDLFVDDSGDVYSVSPGGEYHNVIVSDASWVSGGRKIYDEWYNGKWTSNDDRVLPDSADTGSPASSHAQFLRKFGPLSGGSGYQLDKLYRLAWRTAAPRWWTLTRAKTTAPSGTDQLQWGFSNAVTQGRIPYDLTAPVCLTVNGSYAIRGTAGAGPSNYRYTDYQFISNEWRPKNTSSLVTAWNIMAADTFDGSAEWSYLFGRDNVTLGLNQQDRQSGQVAALVNCGGDVLAIGVSSTGSGGTSVGFPCIERLSAGSGSRTWQVGLSASGYTNASDCWAYGGAYRRV